jgi:hypothetical protein
VGVLDHGPGERAARLDDRSQVDAELQARNNPDWSFGFKVKVATP